MAEDMNKQPQIQPQTPKVEIPSSEDPKEFVDQSAADAGMPQQPQSVPGPSTPERQEETQKILQDRAIEDDFESRVEKKRKMLARSSGRSLQDVDELEARELLLKDIKKEEAKQLEKQELQAEKEIEEQARVQAALEKYKNLKSEYQARNLPFKERPEFEQLLNEERQQFTQNIMNQEQELQDELDRKKQEEEIQRQQEVDAEKQAIRQQENQVEAERQVAAEKIVEAADEKKRIQTEIEEEDKSQTFTNFDEFWESRTTGQKILTGIGMFLGLFSGSNDNAMDVINDQIDKNIAAKKAAKEDYWKQKEYSLKVIDSKIKRMRAQTANKESQIKLEKLRYEIQKDAQKAREQRELTKRLSSTKGLTREEVFSLPREDQKRVVPVGNTNYLAFNAEVAKKLNNEVIPSAKSSLRGLNRLKEILEMPAAEVRPTLIAESATIKQALKGNLRLELFGPGVMTDFESRMADKIIGDPTKILTLDMAERAKFNALIKKIKYSTKDKIKQAGVNLPPSPNERMVKQMKKNNPKMKEHMIIEALMKKGYWKEDDLGF